jgi:hypothetical protein
LAVIATDGLAGDRVIRRADEQIAPGINERLGDFRRVINTEVDLAAGVVKETAMPLSELPETIAPMRS